MNINLEGCRGVTSVYNYNPGLPRLVVLLKTVHLGLQSMWSSNQLLFSAAQPLCTVPLISLPGLLTYLKHNCVGHS